MKGDVSDWFSVFPSPVHSVIRTRAGDGVGSGSDWVGSVVAAGYSPDYMMRAAARVTAQRVRVSVR